MRNLSIAVLMFGCMIRASSFVFTTTTTTTTTTSSQCLNGLITGWCSRPPVRWSNTVRQLSNNQDEQDRPLNIYGDDLGPSMFGLTPKQELDSLDSGILFIGPMVLAASLYLIFLPFIDEPVIQVQQQFIP